MVVFRESSPPSSAPRPLLHKMSPASATFAPSSNSTPRLERTLVCAMASSKPAARNREPRGIMKSRRVSLEMQEVVGVSEIAQTQALKLIWAHIKEHNLQDSEDKKTIICDEKLKKIFGGKDRVGFLEIHGLISPIFFDVLH